MATATPTLDFSLSRVEFTRSIAHLRGNDALDAMMEWQQRRAKQRTDITLRQRITAQVRMIDDGCDPADLALAEAVEKVACEIRKTWSPREAESRRDYVPTHVEVMCFNLSGGILKFAG